MIEIAAPAVALATAQPSIKGSARRATENAMSLWGVGLMGTHRKNAMGQYWQGYATRNQIKCKQDSNKKTL
ncbi:hypothetical protein RGQ30_16640 [Limnobacter thiooxidans]|uniref:Uncharacterized protein n=1 Tax=Limnobacter thiooxidans TaxID=131080 RepID=A0AA86IZF4_9BURK|nr:hypothetical protein RGQ30_16640 [Limnobacter thiooxidans]